MLKVTSGTLVRRGTLMAAFAVAVVLLAAPVSAALVVSPWQAVLPTGPEVAPADAAGTGGLDVLEPGRPSEGPVVTKAGKDADPERAVREWHPTGGGHPHPKPSPKG
jgi:hypothetical protein